MSTRVISNRCRNGFTLVELLVSVSASALLLSLNGVWIYQTMRYSARVTQRHHDHQNLTRLADEFRDNVRSCQKVEVVNDNEVKLTWRVRGESSSDSDASGFVPTASYKIDGVQLLLTKQITKSQSKQERYALASNTVIGWDDSEMPDAIGLIVSRDPAKIVDRKFYPDQKIDSADVLPVRSTPPDQLSTLIHVRVSPNRWGSSVVQQPTAKPKLKPKPQADTEAPSADEDEKSIEIEPDSEPASKAKESEAVVSEEK